MFLFWNFGIFLWPLSSSSFFICQTHKLVCSDAFTERAAVCDKRIKQASESKRAAEKELHTQNEELDRVQEELGSVNEKLNVCVCVCVCEIPPMHSLAHASSHQTITSDLRQLEHDRKRLSDIIVNLSSSNEKTPRRFGDECEAIFNAIQTNHHRFRRFSLSLSLSLSPPFSLLASNMYTNCHISYI